MRLLPLSCLILSLAGVLNAADSPPRAVAKKNARAAGAAQLPVAVEGLSDEAYAQVKRGLVATFDDEAIVAARKRLSDLMERARFVKGRNESEDLRMDFDKARDTMVKATIEAIARFDAGIPKDDVVKALVAIEELIKKRGQEANRMAQEKAAATERAAVKQPKDDAMPAPEEAAKQGDAKPATPADLLADIEGVSAEDMRKFRAAAFKAQRDPHVKELKAKRNQLQKEAEFLSQEEKKNLRGDFEQLQADLRKANLAAIAAAAPDLPKETLEKIFDAVETRTRESIEKSGKKKATKTPLKPFPFGEKK
ncbi:MAG: hypothetical protein ACKOBS_00855 [Verrucomicrobiota bacterium]